MSAVATAPRPQSVGTDARVTFPRLLRSEWIKLWSVKSTVWTLAITAVVIVGLVQLITWGELNVRESLDDTSPMNALSAFGGTAYVGPLAVAVLGALSITGEYTTGMIRSSLTAAPRRLPVLWSKAAVLAFVVFVVSAVSVAVAALLQALFFGGRGVSVDAGDPQVLRALVGNALYVTAIALLAFGLGALMRHSAGAITTTLGILMVLPILFQLIPWAPLRDLVPYLPNVAGSQITLTDAMIAEQGGDGVVLSAWAGFGVLMAYVVVVTAAAAVLLKKRDA
ncbi:ABC transporter permease subunit [Cellulomonas sp. DKR-3]|uniref:ABC transporter permease subunit n=1 Tax=Cellulomonas fulva TaxID=2835530 RepID=A0ABS5TUP7_9CELL|nr:ABC transporter permease subunit [Cellulomonas fulva]MBT0992865.1 ABC transporter permease subunit [Cellulomonas fulva]